MKKQLLALTLTFASVLPMGATQFILENFDITLRDSNGEPWNGLFVDSVELGIFDNGFTPTAGNLASWQANWLTGVNGGYYDSSGPEWSSHILINDNSTFAIGQQLSLWVFDDQSAGSQWALYTDPTWLVTASTPGDPTNHFLGFTASTVALFGTFDFGGGMAATASLSAIPEPSTYAALAGLGALGLAVYRRKQRVMAA